MALLAGPARAQQAGLVEPLQKSLWSAEEKRFIINNFVVRILKCFTFADFVQSIKHLIAKHSFSHIYLKET